MHENTVGGGLAGRTWPTAWFRRASLLALAVSLTTGGAELHGASPDYRYIEGGLFRIDPDRGSSDNGYFFGGSYGTKRAQFFAEYGDPGDPEIWTVGAGWHGLLGSKADLVAQAAFVDADFDDGLRTQVGVRWMIRERLEINGFFVHSDLDLFDTTGVSVGGIWDFARRLGVGGTYESGDDVDTLRAFVRFNFGRR